MVFDGESQSSEAGLVLLRTIDDRAGLTGALAACLEDRRDAPQLGFLSFDDEPDQHLFHARLRPGNSRCWRGAMPLLRRTVAQLREAFPRAVIRVRLDAGFCCPRTLLTLEELGVDYVVAIQGNSRLEAKAERYLAKARRRAKRSGESAKVFGDYRYAPRDKSRRQKVWPQKRRIVVKAEVVAYPGREPRDNLATWSLICVTRRRRCMPASTAGAARSRTGSRS